MEKFRLISMTDFVIQTYNELPTSDLIADKVFSYANFLNEPLTLGMFVPCDDDGNVLEEPICENQNQSQQLMEFAVKSKIFDKAQSKVIFSPVTFKQLKSQDDPKFYFVGDTQVFNLSKDNKNLYWHHYSVESLLSDFDESIDLAVSF